MTIHDEQLDAPFETFEHEGIIYHQVGLMQAWVRGYTDPAQYMMTEPPQWTAEFRQWLEDHRSSIAEWIVGPPIIAFPDRETEAQFKVEWHDKARERYPIKGDALVRTPTIGRS